MQEWRIIDTGYASGYRNMAVDEAIMLEHARGNVPPTLRLYRWDPPTLTIGYFQDLAEEIDVEACRKEGFNCVRRLTGGRAILHDDELTYSIVAREDNATVSGTILESYLKISQGIVQSLANLGIAVEVASGAKKEKGSAACFDSPSWYEITCQGRKLAGSAQTRKQGVILQHGSVPLSLDAEKLFNVLKCGGQEAGARLAARFRQQACALNDIASERITYSRAVEAFASGFAQGLGVAMVRRQLTPAELELAEKLEQEKYRTTRWNFERR